MPNMSSDLNPNSIANMLSAIPSLFRKAKGPEDEALFRQAIKALDAARAILSSECNEHEATALNQVVSAAIGAAGAAEVLSGYIFPCADFENNASEQQIKTALRPLAAEMVRVTREVTAILHKKSGGGVKEKVAQTEATYTQVGKFIGELAVKDEGQFSTEHALDHFHNAVWLAAQKWAVDDCKECTNLVTSIGDILWGAR